MPKHHWKVQSLPSSSSSHGCVPTQLWQRLSLCALVRSSFRVFPVKGVGSEVQLLCGRNSRHGEQGGVVLQLQCRYRVWYQFHWGAILCSRKTVYSISIQQLTLGCVAQIHLRLRVSLVLLLSFPQPLVQGQQLSPSHQWRSSKESGRNSKWGGFTHSKPLSFAFLQCTRFKGHQNPSFGWHYSDSWT